MTMIHNNVNRRKAWRIHFHYSPQIEQRALKINKKSIETRFFSEELFEKV